MNKTTFGIAMIAMLAGAASADVYGDNTGNHLDGGDMHDFFYSQGFTHLDIVSVEITNDMNNLYVDIQLSGDLDATAWGKYALGINTGVNAGDTGNGWGRNISWGGQTITHWVATWADDGGSGIGGQVWDWDGGAWNTNANIASGDDSQHASGHQIFAISLADLGLSVGDTFTFDVVSTGGGFDPGVDHLSRSDFATDDWGNQSVAGQFLSYTIVPAPGSLALLGLGGLGVARRRR